MMTRSLKSTTRTLGYGDDIGYNIVHISLVHLRGVYVC